MADLSRVFAETLSERVSIERPARSQKVQRRGNACCRGRAAGQFAPPLQIKKPSDSGKTKHEGIQRIPSRTWRGRLASSLSLRRSEPFQRNDPDERNRTGILTSG